MHLRRRSRRIERDVRPNIFRRLTAEALGSFFLFAGVIGSGVMAEALAGGNVAIALIGNTAATGAILQFSAKARAGVGQSTGEPIATFGLILTILATVRYRPAAVPASVALYITVGYWFPSSTSFANPAITIVRSLSNSFAGIAPVDVPGFVVAQLAGMGLAVLLCGWLLKGGPEDAG